MSAVASAPMREGLARRLARLAALRPAWSVERLALACSLLLSVAFNGPFWHAVAATGGLAGARGLLSAAALFVLVTALQLFVLLLLGWGRAARPVYAALLVLSAFVAWYEARYAIYFNTDMLRNVLHTDAREASEYLTPWLLLPLLAGGVLPALAIARVRVIAAGGAWRALARRAGWMAATVLVAALAALSSFQDLSALMRNHRELRHLITPGNVLVSAAVVARQASHAPRQRRLLGVDAVARPHARPRVLVLVVGETVRAANWGLSGYARQTTPRLARIGPVNFADVASCGTSTEVSLPCMFSPDGRAGYDKALLDHSESLLHVLDRAGLAVSWRDNQSGCKGVCDGLPTWRTRDRADGCPAEGCLDATLLDGLDAAIAAQPGDAVVVLHMLGNHGPAYHLRHPPEARPFTPTCDSADLGDCSRARIVSSYDNAVAYTDAVLAQAIGQLAAQRHHDAALVYVSDHGESLGENGLYLHGLPYAIAPATQTRVPMSMWVSPGFAAGRGLDMACLRRRATQPTSHDALFHSVLGLMQVATRDYRPDRDLFAGCTAPAAAG